MYSLIFSSLIVLMCGGIFFMATCRIVKFDMYRYRWRYAVAPVLLLFGATCKALDVIAGGPPEWYIPLILAAVTVWLYNNSHEWVSGVPSYMKARDSDGSLRTALRNRENQAAAFIFTTVVLGAALQYTVFAGQPYKYFTGRAIPDVVEPGQMVQVEWNGKRYRDCKATIVSYWTDTKGRIVGTHQSIGGAAHPGRRSSTIVDRRVPDSAERGRPLFYQAVMSSECPDGDYVTRSPMLELRTK